MINSSSIHPSPGDLVYTYHRLNLETAAVNSQFDSIVVEVAALRWAAVFLFQPGYQYTSTEIRVDTKQATSLDKYITVFKFRCEGVMSNLIDLALYYSHQPLFNTTYSRP